MRGYYLPSTPSLDQLVGREEAEVFLASAVAVKTWKDANPDPYFVVPLTFEGQCKKFGVVMMMRYECKQCFGNTQKPCVVIIPGKHELLFRFRCLVTSRDYKAHFKLAEETA